MKNIHREFFTKTIQEAAHVVIPDDKISFLENFNNQVTKSTNLVTQLQSTDPKLSNRDIFFNNASLSHLAKTDTVVIVNYLSGILLKYHASGNTYNSVSFVCTNKGNIASISKLKSDDGYFILLNQKFL